MHHRGSQYPRAVGPPWRPPAVNILIKIYGKSNFSFLEKRNLMRIKFLISSHFSLSEGEDVFPGLGSPGLTGISLLYKGNPEVAGRSWPGPTLPVLPGGHLGSRRRPPSLLLHPWNPVAQFGEGWPLSPHTSTTLPCGGSLGPSGQHCVWLAWVLSQRCLCSGETCSTSQTTRHKPAGLSC